MRTNIVLDDDLIKNAFKVSGVSTKKELITIALEEFVKNRTRFDIKELKGKIAFTKGYNHKALRKG